MPPAAGQTTVVAGITPVIPTAVCLQQTPIPDVVPLDSQTGIWPLKTVPDTLLDALFAQPEPTAVEIAEYGDKTAVPPMKTYVVIDTAKLVQGRSVVEACDLPWRCLLKGEVAEELGDVLPYLIELDQDARFTRVLLTHLPDVAKEMATMHLCHKEPGIFIRSRADMDTLWGHLRKYTRVSDDAGKWYFFRFWEGRNLSGVLEAMSQNQLTQFFRGIASIVAVYRGAAAWKAEVYSLEEAQAAQS
ncbi:DUF4123 domain-containing protein [Litoreibacter albidus]|uniref:DUF4123 domain-containing protein n=1 Tax=Litoreibacter albidus TaxID=670155 RepID=UPI00373628DF